MRSEDLSGAAEEEETPAATSSGSASASAAAEATAEEAAACALEDGLSVPTHRVGFCVRKGRDFGSNVNVT